MTEQQRKSYGKKENILLKKLGRTTFDSFTTNAQNIIVPENSYNSDKLDNLGLHNYSITITCWKL